MADSREDFKYTITKELGVLSENMRGWKKEVNFVSWNDRPPKLDIRDWNETHDKMGKGVTLTGSEARTLLEILNEAVLDELED